MNIVAVAQIFQKITMVFSSVIFLNIFFPIVLVIYYTVSRLTDRDATRTRRAKNITLLLASIAFYGAGGYKYLLLLGAVLLINYFGGLATDSLPFMFQICPLGARFALALLMRIKENFGSVEEPEILRRASK